MKAKTKTIQLSNQGVDCASETIRDWLEAEGVSQRDVLRIRLTMEELLSVVSGHTEDQVTAQLRFKKSFGDRCLVIRYDGDKFNPTAPVENELEGWTADLLSRTGFVPAWHWRAKQNELVLRIPGKKQRTELLMLGCLAAAIGIGFLGLVLPAGIKTGITEYVLRYLSDGFLNLLSIFIGLMIFLCIVTGICGIGSAKSFGRIGKFMISRFVVSTFAICAVFTFAAYFLFPLHNGAGGTSFKFSYFLDMVFQIIPSNPIQPFLEGNTLQIVLLAAIFGFVLLLAGSRAEGVRSIVFQLHTIMLRCVTGICMLIPLYIISSLVMTFWESGMGVLLLFWKPLILCLILLIFMTAIYIIIVCLKLKVRAAVLVSKLLPAFLIALSTASSAAAFSTSLEINEKKLGIDPSFSKTAIPIGNILFTGGFSLIFVIPGAFLAQYYGVEADLSWWIILWFICSLFSMATPPVPGGMISCLSILLAQLKIPAEGLILATTLTLFFDFFCTSFNITLLHLETTLQADRLNLLNPEILRKKE